MEFNYKKALEKHNLKISQLPEDAQTGIDNINDILKGITMLEKRGKKATPKTIKKLQAMDKWVYYEILDFLEGTDENDDEMPVDTEEVINEIKQQAQEDSSQNNQYTKEQQFALSIEKELEGLYLSGNKEYSIEDIKSNAKTTYNVLFDNYEDGEDNGIMTTRYKLIETKPKVFTISKN